MSIVELFLKWYEDREPCEEALRRIYPNATSISYNPFSVQHPTPRGMAVIEVEMHVGGVVTVKEYLLDDFEAVDKTELDELRAIRNAWEEASQLLLQFSTLLDQVKQRAERVDRWNAAHPDQALPRCTL